MRARLGKFLRFLGPHPYNLGQIFLFFWAFFFSRYVPLVLAQPAGLARTLASVLIVFLALIPAGAFAGSAWLWNRFRPWSKNNLGFYLLEVMLSVLAFNLAFYLAFTNPFFETLAGLKGTTSPPTPQLQLVSFVITVFLLAALHKTDKQIQNRLAKADSLVAQLENEVQLLILAEAEIKIQVSQFLHDRVQSSLMVISVRLQKIATTKSPSVQDSELTRVIESLETLRMQDLRLAINALSPNLDAMGLDVAISLLISKNVSDTALEVNLPSIVEEFPDNLKLAIFKIAEQAILNSQMHGSAKHIEVSLMKSKSDVWLLRISDDGSGSSGQESQPGLGTAFIDSWTRVLEGTKRIVSSPTTGYSLEISFPNK